MSGAQRDGALMADSLPLNTSTEVELQDGEMSASFFEFRVFNIVIIALALCILTVTAVYCVILCYHRTRQSKRAHIYESAVTRGEPEDPVEVRGVKRSTSFINPLAFFRKAEAAKDNSRIYYIYSNPLPVGLREEEEKGRSAGSSRPEEQNAPVSPLSLQDYAKDPNSGVVLDPPIFYMQL
ncbi:unnamed protein product [Menidia menidia]|uniref:(Atlantic silverside) hypothetical protein n=1 Tax=Menidia menidia TaxID=238744 RepID=A0A8S4B3L1_9TELE|nr:unnamed protein product [Menidia menidia]